MAGEHTEVPSALRAFAWIQLIAGIIATVGFLVIGRDEYGQLSAEGATTAGIALVAGVVGSALLFATAIIVEDLRAARNLLAHIARKNANPIASDRLTVG